jgi:hypothetical protein
MIKAHTRAGISDPASDHQLAGADETVRVLEACWLQPDPCPKWRFPEDLFFKFYNLTFKN